MSRPKINELFDLISIETGITSKTIRKIFVAFYKIFINQLNLNGRILIPKFGSFVISRKKERILRVGDPHNGGVKYIHVKPDYEISFQPSKTLMDIINKRDFDVGNVLVRKKNSKSNKNKKQEKTELSVMTRLLNRVADRERKESQDGEAND